MRNYLSYNGSGSGVEVYFSDSLLMYRMVDGMTDKTKKSSRLCTFNHLLYLSYHFFRIFIAFIFILVRIGGPL